MNKKHKPICELFTGGKCPVCDDELEVLGIGVIEAERINKDCCENSYIPTEKDLEKWFKRSKENVKSN